jgi:hypothetical protein
MPTCLSFFTDNSLRLDTCVLRFCRAIKRYSVAWRNLAVVRTVWSVVDVTLAVTDDGIR